MSPPPGLPRGSRLLLGPCCSLGGGRANFSLSGCKLRSNQPPELLPWFPKDAWNCSIVGSLYWAPFILLPMRIPNTPMVLLEVTSTAGCNFPQIHKHTHTHTLSSLVPLRGDLAAKSKDMCGGDRTVREQKSHGVLGCHSCGEGTSCLGTS